MGWWTVILKEFSILSFHIFCFFLWLNCCTSLPSPYPWPSEADDARKPRPPKRDERRAWTQLRQHQQHSPGWQTNKQTNKRKQKQLNQIQQCEIHMKPRKRKNFLQVCYRHSLPSSSFSSSYHQHLRRHPLLHAPYPLVNCPTQPTCIAHFDLCNCHNKLQWKYDKNTAWQLAPYPHPHPRPHHPHRNLQAWLNKFPSRAKKIDVLARVIFPAIFAFFNMSYWTFYLTQEANTDVKWTLKATILYETGVFYQEKRRIHVRISFEASCELHKMHSRCLSSSEVQDGTTMMCCYQCLSGRKMFKVFVQ